MKKGKTIWMVGVAGMAVFVSVVLVMSAVSISNSEDTVPPVVNIPQKTVIIPEDTDGVPSWGEMVNISINDTKITENSSISTVTALVDGGNTINLTLVGNTTENGTLWCIFGITNASVGPAKWNGTAYEPYHLQINATDIYNNSNVSVSIDLTVMRNGDVYPYNGDGKVDFLHDALYLARYTRGSPGYQVIRENIADVTGDGKVDFLHDALYLARYTRGSPGYTILH